ncbi:hypothetical protein AK830_g10836 [Neonectria ditissima]|uniref:CPAF-like PDZ domain-containing protein n=1 Tax=Neonectria ditissima TaxID=78410 RepID=A0A0P7B2S3_9HYPO|nr:hypothetical protein AK830_g10836 [Neonectria ditissima]
MLPLLYLLSLGLPLVAASSFSEPCALVTEKISEYQEENPSSPAVYIDGQLAEECLQSIPFYAELADQFLEELGKYVEWQSTLEVLKNPPDTYASKATDIIGGLEKIRKIAYSSQWEFDQAIRAVFSAANDGHFYITLCSFSPFTFVRANVALVSVSTDGVKTPELYTSADSVLLNNTKVKVSPVKSINGQDPTSYLEKIADTKSSQDPDARYNQLFYSIPNLALGNAVTGFFTEDVVYPGSNITTLEFRNGSTAEFKTVAKLRDVGFNATSGKDVFELYCRPTPSSSSLATRDESNEAESTISPPLESGPAGYPEPLIRDPYSQMNGYSLDKDTAVMLIPSFDGNGKPDNHSLTFANYASEIVSQAVANGRSKLIIDVSGNGGGNIVRAFDLFKLFFPSEFPYSGTRFRRHEASEGIATIFSIVNESLAYQNAPFGYSVQVKPDQASDFASYEDFLGDTTQLGVKVSSLYANFNYTAMSGASDEAPIHGYGGWPLNQTQPFKAENILIIGDGVCASTCTTFVNLMTNVGGVRALPFGGHPNGKPMQIMGGVRGAQSMSFDNIAGYVANAIAVAQESPEELSFISQKDIEGFVAAAPVPPAQFPIAFGGGNVNLRNAYQEGDDDLPLQFQYQAGDCRLYYTIENILHPETTWKSAKEAIWGNGTCIKGSTGGLGSLKDRENKAKKNETESGEKGDKKKSGEEGGKKSGKEGGEESGGGEDVPASGAAAMTVGWSMFVMAIAGAVSLL